MNNENLEKIKQLCDVEVPYNEVCSIHANALGEIQEAAERMAEEIEKAYITVRLNVEDKERAAMKIEQLEYEITQLKAELEKRPEVVRCVECKHKEWCRKSINKDGHGDMCPLSFCSAGQRRESEGK